MMLLILSQNYLYFSNSFSSMTKKDMYLVYLECRPSLRPRHAIRIPPIPRPRPRRTSKPLPNDMYE